ncbi:N-acetyltransferase family protein [Azospirillum sp. sgz302134]
MTVPEGFLDGVGRAVTGWAWLPCDPGRRLRVEVLFGDSTTGREWRVETVADRHRGDLEAAGKGDGCHGFAVPVPDALAGREHAVDVRLPEFPDAWPHAWPGARLPGAPRMAIETLGPVVVRPILPSGADVERLGAFLAEAVRLNGGSPSATAVPDAAALRDWLAGSDRRDADRCWLVAERAGRVVGQCRIGPEWPAEPGTGALAFGIELHPDVRGFGLGRHLILAAHRWAAGRCTRMELAVLPHNGRALRLYRKLGYTDLGPVGLPGTGEIHRRMAVSLTPSPSWRPRPGDFVLVV